MEMHGVAHSIDIARLRLSFGTSLHAIPACSVGISFCIGLRVRCHGLTQTRASQEGTADHEALAELHVACIGGISVDGLM